MDLVIWIFGGIWDWNKLGGFGVLGGGFGLGMGREGFGLF